MARFLLTSIAVLTLAACQRGGSADHVTIDLGAKSKGGTVIARFKGGEITVEDVNRQLSALPPMVRMRMQGTGPRKDFVEGQVRIELLAREAIRQGLQNEPDAVESYKKALAQKVLLAQLEKAAPQPTDDEIKTWYDNHQADYQRPETVQVQDLFLAADAKDAAKRKTRTAEAEKLRSKAKALKPDDEKGFGDLVKASSDDPLTRAIGGDLRPMPIGDLQARYGTEVAEAVKKLQTPGEISSVVATDKGFHILRFKARMPAHTLPLEDVKLQIKNRLYSERRSAASDELLNRLKSESGYTLDEAALAQIAGPPAGMPGMAPHGGMGMPPPGHPGGTPPSGAPPQTR
ncbi:MAG TPA: peptidyl-prolyl cis-trans isomerase [Myxococcaceae bacterium]|nr:peptidyl-prolyl cis-trans isomerase [Myxococcaceae bacterium]